MRSEANMIGFAKALAALVCAMSCAACGSEPPGGTDFAAFAAAVEQHGALRWTESDNPNLMTSDLDYTVSVLPTQGQASRIPWPGSYWPTFRDSINHRWAGPDVESPAEKYGRAFGVPDMAARVSQYVGVMSQGQTSCTSDYQCDSRTGERCAWSSAFRVGRCVATWFGLCHAWAPAAILEPEPVRPVRTNGVTFYVNDLKALLTLAYDHTNTRAVSLRCNRNNGAGQISYDAYGRPSPSNAECLDTNPGTFHVIVTNLLGVLGRSFVEDRVFDSEVWNQPVRSYEVLRLQQISSEEANSLVSEGAIRDPRYQFNVSAERLYYVQTRLDYIGETSSTQDGNLAAFVDRFTHSDTYEYVLEADASDRIIGGEWLGSSKRQHPDFLWLPVDRGVNRDNPVEYAYIKQLLNASVSGSTDDEEGRYSDYSDYGTGSYGTGSYGTGSDGTGSYGTGSDGTGSYGTGSYGR